MQIEYRFHFDSQKRMTVFTIGTQKACDASWREGSVWKILILTSNPAAVHLTSIRMSEVRWFIYENSAMVYQSLYNVVTIIVYLIFAEAHREKTQVNEEPPIVPVINVTRKLSHNKIIKEAMLLRRGYWQENTMFLLVQGIWGSMLAESQPETR